MSSSAIRSLPRTLTPGTWVLDPEQSSVKFMVLSMPPAWGRFTELEGSLEVGEDALANGRGQIAASSIRTGFPPRDAHLRSSHFFDVERHARITAAVSLAENTSGQASVDVALTIKGVTRNVHLDGVVAPVNGKPGSARVSASGSINRRDFGVSWLGADRLMIGNRVRIRLDLMVTIEPNRA